MDIPSESPSDSHLTRRLLGAASLMMTMFARDLFAQGTRPLTSEQSAHETQTAAAVSPLDGSVQVRLTVNGRSHDLRLDPRTGLLDLLREQLGLTGTKKGCDHGQCGACTVLVNGVRMNACLSLAAQRDGDAVVTVEGLVPEGLMPEAQASGQKLHPVQAAFVHHDAFQCGYCTPGQIMSSVGMFDELKRGVPSIATASSMSEPKVNAAEIRERMSGNICRCAAYPNIVAALMAAADEMLR